MNKEFVTTVVVSMEPEDVCGHPLYPLLSTEAQWGFELLTDDRRYPTPSYDLSLDVTVHGGIPAKIHGPPEDCYPSESAYAEVALPDVQKEVLSALFANVAMLMSPYDIFTGIDITASLVAGWVEKVRDNFEEYVDFPEEGDF